MRSFSRALINYQHLVPVSGSQQPSVTGKSELSWWKFGGGLDMARILLIHLQVKLEIADWMRSSLLSFATSSWRKKPGLQSEIFQVHLSTELIFDLKVSSWWENGEMKTRKERNFLAWLLPSAFIIWTSINFVTIRRVLEKSSYVEALAQFISCTQDRKCNV